MIISQAAQWTPVIVGAHVHRRHGARRGTCLCSLAGDWAGGVSAAPQEPVKKKPRSIAGIDQSVLLDPWLLADPNSRFAEYNGVQVHYKISSSAGGAQVCPAILLHGFGASVFSWERLLEPLSRLLSSAAVAFDRPGFGLTSRVLPVPSDSSVNPYSLGFSADITVAFIDFLKAEKAILIGHSAGCIVAADAYFRAPERIAAIVMVAPAIVAPVILKPNKSSQTDNTVQQPTSESQPGRSPGALIQFIVMFFMRLRLLVVKLFSRLVRLARALKEIVAALYCRMLTLALRSRVAIWLIQRIMDVYAEKVVRYAWYNPDKADKYVIRGYTKPLGCRNWERALLEYVIALVASRSKGQKLVDRLATVSCPVLVITGDSDRFVPAWNAERLSRVFPRCSFKTIKECGHLPHEEKPEEVIGIVREFLDKFL